MQKKANLEDVLSVIGKQGYLFEILARQLLSVYLESTGKFLSKPVHAQK